MPANNLVCKFDPSHGLFITPVKLSQHYAAEHGDAWTPKGPNLKQYRCRLCGGTYRNPSSHVHQMHPDESPNRPYVGRIIDRIADSVDMPRGRHANDSPPAVVNGHDLVHDEPATTVPRHVGPWHVDDIVLPVVEQLAGPRAMIPVAHLAAILAWRDATAVMLATVTR
jgi:hypothetical protein